MHFEYALLTVAVLLGLSVIASKIGSKVGIPVLLVFIAIGMLAGSEGLGGIWFDDAASAQKVGIVALSYILFAGGMDTHWQTTKPILGKALCLATFGVVATAAVVGLIANRLLGFSFQEGLLLGSIIASTDASAVFSILSSGSVKIRDDVRALLEVESGTNDPTAVFLTLGLTTAIAKGTPISPLIAGNFVWEMALGALWGAMIGKLGVIAMKRLHLQFEAMYHVVSIAIVLASYSGAVILHSSGFLAVYIAGLVYGQGSFRQKKGLRRFHDGIAWLMQIVMFLVLGLLVFPSRLHSVALAGCLISLVLIFVARPIGTFLSLSLFRESAATKTLVAWAGLRGAVPIILATFPLLAGITRANEIFNIVFFVVLFSTVIQGATLPWVIRAVDKQESEPA
ncbi:MAG: potassium/proton antiporter [Armatimonadetes bacterium]|nr:potassium/proton antiporter [Armatimonadota bacterium]